MSEQSKISVSAVCRSCSGTGLYVGMAERNGAAVVCATCRGTGETSVAYEPFVERAAPPEKVTSVHVARGYGLDPAHPLCDGGMPVEGWKPGATVPADEKLYCPFLYTHQDWCAHPDPKWGGPPFAAVGRMIPDCPLWPQKAECWQRYHEASDAPGVSS